MPDCTFHVAIVSCKCRSLIRTSSHLDPSRPVSFRYAVAGLFIKYEIILLNALAWPPGFLVDVSSCSRFDPSKQISSDKNKRKVSVWLKIGSICFVYEFQVRVEMWSLKPPVFYLVDQKPMPSSFTQPAFFHSPAKIWASAKSFIISTSYSHSTWSLNLLTLVKNLTRKWRTEPTEWLVGWYLDEPNFQRKKNQSQPPFINTPARPGPARLGLVRSFSAILYINRNN